MHACVHARMYMFASRGGGGAQAAARGRHTGDKAGAAHLLAAHADGHKKALSQKLLSDLATEASARTSDNRDAPPPPSSAPPPRPQQRLPLCRPRADQARFRDALVSRSRCLAVARKNRPRGRAPGIRGCTRPLVQACTQMPEA